MEGAAPPLRATGHALGKFSKGSSSVAATAPLDSRRMRCLRHTTTAALVTLALHVTPAYAGDLVAGVRVANAVYPGVPQRCGTVKIDYGTLSPPNDTNGAIAEANEAECMVRIRPGIVTTYSDAQVCSLLTHEWGHLAGRTFFDNVGDPYHSLNPADNMYGSRLVHHRACGESDDVKAAREAREARARIAAEDAATVREDRRAEIVDRLSELTHRLRAAKAGKRRAHGARRDRYARRIKRLRARITRLRAEYRSLRVAPLL